MKSIGQKLADLIFKGYDDNLKCIKNANTMCPDPEKIKSIFREAAGLNNAISIRQAAGIKTSVFSLVQTEETAPVKTDIINNIGVGAFVRDSTGTYKANITIPVEEMEHNPTIIPETRLIQDNELEVTGAIKVVPTITSSEKSITIYTYKSADKGVTYTLADGMLSGAIFKIELYESE